MLDRTLSAADSDEPIASAPHYVDAEPRRKDNLKGSVCNTGVQRPQRGRRFPDPRLVAAIVDSTFDAHILATNGTQTVLVEHRAWW